MMMHQNRTKLGNEFDHLILMQSTRRFYPAIAEIQGCRVSHWTTLYDKNWPRKPPTATMVIKFLHQKSERKCVRKRPFRNGHGNPTELKPCAKVRNSYESGESELSIAVLNVFWDWFLEILYVITWALDQKWSGITNHTWKAVNGDGNDDEASRAPTR